MTTRLMRSALLASSLAFALLATLPPAMAQSEHDGHHPQNAAAAAATQNAPQNNGMPSQGNRGAGQMPQGGMMDHGQMNHGQMMDHGSMDHQQMMQQMHAEHMTHGQMNHGSVPPAGSKDGQDGK